MRHRLFAASVMALMAFATGSTLAAENGQDLSNKAKHYAKVLRKAVTVAGIRKHQLALQNIADSNSGTRASGTPGFSASVDYVKGKLLQAGYNVSILPFDFAFYQENSPSELQQISPSAVTYVNGPDFVTMEYSGAGDVTATLQAAGGTIVPPTPAPSSASGCDPADFAGFAAGNIALIQRGGCFFIDKANNAIAAGAVGVIIFNEGQPGRTDAFGGTLGEPVSIPVLSASFAVGEALFGTANATVRVRTDTSSEVRETYNILADSRTGNASRAVVVGAHLDSVLEGPGINDNGSGTAVNLETAIQLAKAAPELLNKVRFMFFGAEEAGLLGSEDYAASLTPEQLNNILLNLNFDMLGSPNYARLVYDGDGSDTPDAGPPGSDIIEKAFADYFKERRLVTEPTAFDGRSDYGPFIDRGIPAGGLFSGAEELKTAEQVIKFGGTEGVQLDPCYHEACDTYANNNDQALEELGDAAAHSIATFAFAGPGVISRAPAIAARTQRTAASARFYKGPNLQK